MTDSETQQQMISKTPRHEVPQAAYLLLEEYSNEAANLLIEGYSNALALWGTIDIKAAPNLEKRPREKRIENRLDAQHVPRHGFASPVHGKIRNGKTRQSGERRKS